MMAKNYLYNLLLTLANLLFPIISFPYVSHIIGPEGIGKVQFAFSFALYFALIAGLGIPVYGVKEIAAAGDDSAKRSKVFSELLTIYVITSVLLTTIYLGVIFSVPYFKADLKMYLNAGLLIILSFCSVDWVYTGLQQFKAIALRAVLFKTINLLLLFVFIKHPDDFRNYLYLMMFSFLGNNVLSIFLLRGKVQFTLKGLKITRHLPALILVLATIIAASMYTEMDTVMLGFLSGHQDRAVGLYTAAVKLTKIAIPFVTSLGMVLLPKSGRDFAEQNLTEVQRSLDQTFRFLAFFGVPVAFGLFLLAPQFISLFSGREFADAKTSMQILAPLPLIIGFGHCQLNMILVPSGHNRESFFCVAGGMFVSVVVNFLLVPHFGAFGASVANLAAEIVVTFLYYKAIARHFDFRYQWKLIFESALCAALFIPVILMLQYFTLPLIITVLSGVMLSAGVYITAQVVLFKSNFIFDILTFVKAKFTTTAE
ncbi:flippase [Mucilaginibacter sp. RS28]|uniref:Flippase n=1 Tax=Mucilaginibacter straminoryzae TaxID=2932774 RepID=A0A9X2B9J3_9SPHI|nr:flippase [Mucilaginibacter straminoryzae]MCJ8209805.1 flippase [Mucilaginibacter straminoryzae]